MTKLKITHWGGASRIGNSCHLIEYKGAKILLDCGSSYSSPNSQILPLNEKIIRELDAVILTHAHLDHTGNIPLLAKLGFEGPIYSTHPTRDLTRILLLDAYKLGAGKKSMFGLKEINSSLNLMTPLFYKEAKEVGPLTFRFLDAGHILGSAIVQLKLDSFEMIYMSDFSDVKDNHLNKVDISGVKKPEIVVSESTYGDKNFKSRKEREKEIIDSSLQIIKEGGSVLIPSFAVGRIQELMLIFERNYTKFQGNCPIYFCAGLSRKALQIYKNYTAWMNKSIQNIVTTTRKNPFDFKNIKLIESPNQIDLSEPAVYLAASGMLTGGFSSFLAIELIPDKRNLLIFPGYCADNTPAYEILNGSKEVELYDFLEKRRKKVKVKCGIKQINLSAHADQRGLITTLKKMKPKITCLVHGNRPAKEALKEKIKKFTDVKLAEDGIIHEYSFKETHRQLKVNSSILEKIQYLKLGEIEAGLLEGVVIKKGQEIKLVTLEELIKLLKEGRCGKKQ